MKIEDNVLLDLIETKSRVLDVGCGDGNLLLILKKNKNINGRGIEINQQKVTECLSKGLAVIEGDAEKDLVNYPDNSFDFAILNQHSAFDTSCLWFQYLMMMQSHLFV